MLQPNSQVQSDWVSRKYRSAWYLTFIFLALLVVPSVTSFLLTLLWKDTTFAILTVESFVTFISLIWAAYFGANVAQSHNSFVPKTLVEPEDKENGLGGQPPEGENP